jgi:hypothetical protein
LPPRGSLSKWSGAISSGLARALIDLLLALAQAPTRRSFLEKRLEIVAECALIVLPAAAPDKHLPPVGTIVVIEVDGREAVEQGLRNEHTHKTHERVTLERALLRVASIDMTNGLLSGEVVSGSLGVEVARRVRDDA